jgi:hypothetical protein
VAIKKEDIRVTVFGVGSMDQVVCVKKPENVEGCGLYIHSDDIEKFQEYRKQMENENEARSQKET